MPLYRPSFYHLFGQSQTYNPTQNTTRYFGPFVAAPGAAEGFRRGKFAQSGVIRRIDFNVIVTVTASGGEDSTLSLRVNGATPSGGQLTTAFELNSAGFELTFSGLSIPVSAGDTYEFEIVHATTFSVAPTGVIYSWQIEVQVN